jgi:hypothetical protein
VGWPGQVRTQMFAIYFLKFIYGVGRAGVLFWANVGTMKYVDVSFSLRGYDCFFFFYGKLHNCRHLMCEYSPHGHSSEEILYFAKILCSICGGKICYLITRLGTCCEDSIFCIGTTYMIVWFVG